MTTTMRRRFRKILLASTLALLGATGSGYAQDQASWDRLVAAREARKVAAQHDQKVAQEVAAQHDQEVAAQHDREVAAREGRTA